MFLCNLKVSISMRGLLLENKTCVLEFHSNRYVICIYDLNTSVCNVLLIFVLFLR
jgi:hypothetical protein